MGRNLKDFYGNFSGANTGLTRSDAQGPKGGAVLAHIGKRLTAVPDDGSGEVSRKVTRNRDVKKHGKRIAEVAVGNKPKLKNDGGY